MITHKLQLYNRFAHRLVDRDDILYLHSLQVDGIDWGTEQRFAEPVISPDSLRAFTYEYKFCPATSNILPRTGWNRRPILIDLENGRFQAGSWKGIGFNEPLEIKTSWSKINIFWKRPSSFSSPRFERTFNGIDTVNEKEFEFKYWDRPVQMKWTELQKIHFSKRAINTLEIPYLEATVKTTTSESYRVSLPDSDLHPFYLELVKNGFLKNEDLRSFLRSPEPVELTVLTKLGNLQFPIDQGFNIPKAELGILVNGKPIAWEDLPLEPEVLKNVQIGNMQFEQLEISDDDRFDSRFPAKNFHFTFSTINGASNLVKIKEQIHLWSRHLKTEGTVEFRPDWSTFFEMKSASFEMEISYSESEGNGWLILTNEFFRRCLLRKIKFQTGFQPIQHYAFKTSETQVKDFYGIPVHTIFPSPDVLHKPELCFWKDEKGQVGLSDQGFLYLWKKEDLIDFVDEVSDEFADRGGPYYESVLKFKNDGTIRLANKHAIDQARAFLLE